MDEMLKYDRVTEPQKAQKAQIWKTAIGLQAVDGLKTSEYLIDVARQHIEGDITIDEAGECLSTTKPVSLRVPATLSRGTWRTRMAS